MVGQTSGGTGDAAGLHRVGEAGAHRSGLRRAMRATARPVGNAIRWVRRRARQSADAGMTTVEYAIGTVVAAAFAAVLYKIVTGDSIVSGLTSLVESALSPSW